MRESLNFPNMPTELVYEITKREKEGKYTVNWRTDMKLLLDDLEELEKNLKK